MAILKTETISYEENKEKISCKTIISVDKEGYFTTTLPKETVDILKEAKVDLSPNRMRTPGFFSNKNLDALIQNIQDCFKEALSRTLEYECIIIQYSIETQCSYIVHPKTGEFVPNGQHVKGGYDSGMVWKEGTKATGMDMNRYGLQIYAAPFLKRKYIYASGKTKVEYKHLTFLEEYQPEYKGKDNLIWLSGIIRQAPAGPLKEIEYNESIALFFVNMFKSIMKINENIKDILDPESIKTIAENGQKLLA